MTDHTATLGQKATLSKTLSITLTAMFIVLVYVFTLIGFSFTALPGGYLHLGNIPVFIAAMLFGKKIGAISAGVGMALFDIMSPYAAWAPFTLILGLAMGYVVGLVSEKKQSVPYYLLAFFLAAVIKIVGYYFAEVILYGNWIVPFTSIPANLMQVIVGAVAALLIIKPLRMAVDKTLLRPR